MSAVRRSAWWVLAAGFLAQVVVLVTPVRVHAACHAFTVSASPGTVAEGGTVTVTVKRDANLSPSQVDVSTIDETATGGQDYTPVNQTVAFTNDTQKTLTIPITDDAATEGAETFRVHLSNPGGCAVNPNFSLGPDATVTISANDAAAATTTATSPPASPTTAAGSGGAQQRGTASPRATTTTVTTPPTSATEVAAEETTTTTEVDAQAAADVDDDDGVPLGLVVLALAAVVGAGGYAVLALRRRATAR